MGGCFPMLFLLRLVIKINTLPMTDLCGVYLFQSFAWYDVQDPRLIERAANCRIRACDWKAAALLLRDRAIPKQFAEAAKCFEHCGSWSDAAAAWALVPNGLDKALEACCKGKDWAFGVTLIRSSPQPSPVSADSSPSSGVGPDAGLQAPLPRSFDAFVKKACRDCLRQGELEQLQEYITLLPAASALAFFKRYGQ